MTIRINIETPIQHQVFRNEVRARTEVALRRLSKRVADVEVVVDQVTTKGAGEVRCRVSARLRRGGTIHVTHRDPLAAIAVSEALARFRRRAFVEQGRIKGRVRGAARPAHAAVVDGGALVL